MSEEAKLSYLHVYDEKNPHKTKWNQVGAAPFKHSHIAEDFPISTKNALGIVRIGDNISITPDGIIFTVMSDSLILSSSTTYASSKAIKLLNDKFTKETADIRQVIEDLRKYTDTHVTRLDTRITNEVNKLNKTITDLDTKFTKETADIRQVISNEVNKIQNRTIGISGGATGTLTPFGDKTSVTIPVTALNPDFLSKVVPYVKGGTARTDGTCWQADQALKAKYASSADLAEFYISDCKLLPGEVVSISKKEGFDITKATNSSLILGIVSTEPGFTLNSQNKDKENSYPVARIGKVPAYVYGECEKGDMLRVNDYGVLQKTGYPGLKYCYANETKTSLEIDLIEVII